MPARVLLAEYFTTPRSTLLFLVRADRDQPAFDLVDLPAEEALRFARENFGAGRSARSVDLGAWQERFGPLVAPIADHCDEGDVVWFVPHGPLHYLPLHALEVGGRQLIERNPVCYAPSASVMRHCKANRTGRHERALVVGDTRGDLAHAREEALAVAGLFGARPYLREQATKAAVGGLLQREGETLDVLHLACHGRFDAEDALRSGVLLAPGPDDNEETDAALTAAELLDLRLRADLVTLSACESGVSEHRPGDELIGLTRALIHAGTPSVVVSLWRVDDLSAGLLMRGFYERLRGPAAAAPTKAHALQAAQLEVMRRTAGEVVADCTERLAAAGGEPERRLLLELELAGAHAAAGDLDEAIRICEKVARQAGSLPGDGPRRLATRATRTATVLGFKRQVAPPAVSYDARPFEHLAHWSPFVLVGDWE